MSVPDSLIRRSLIAISGLTLVTGAAQVLAPRRMLRALMVEDDDTARHFFGTVGMFMVVVGGGLLNALLRPGRDPVIVFWAALQKLGASSPWGSACGGESSRRSRWASRSSISCRAFWPPSIGGGSDEPPPPADGAHAFARG